MAVVATAEALAVADMRPSLAVAAILEALAAAMAQSLAVVAVASTSVAATSAADMWAVTGSEGVTAAISMVTATIAVTHTHTHTHTHTMNISAFTHIARDHRSSSNPGSTAGGGRIRTPRVTARLPTIPEAATFRSLL